jgi:hypothetical protein
VFSLRSLPFFLALLFVAPVATGWKHDVRADVLAARGVVVPEPPVQIERAGLEPFSIAQYQITPAAEFSLKARVLSAATYDTGREADLSPVDLALGWGPMSDSAVLNEIRITQGERRYYYHWSGAIPRANIVEHSTNMHVIPANDEIRKMLSTVRQGQIVELQGYLVRVRGADGWQWKSSLTRADTGDGACELMWVKTLRFILPTDPMGLIAGAETPNPGPLSVSAAISTP